MSVRRLIARAPLEALSPVFAEIRRDASVAETFPADVAEEADALARLYASDPDAELPHVTGSRRDLTDVPFVTLDPEGSRDLDQAMHLTRDGEDFWVRYAIADVGAHIAPDGAIAREALHRAETVYCPDMRIGLHPPTLSEGFASLLPGQRTKSVVWSFRVDHAGEISEVSVERAWVTSRAQHSYGRLAAGGVDDELVQLLHDFGAVRRRAMRDAGAVTLPKPSQEVTVAEDGLHLEFRAGTPIEDDNAQLSLATGVAAARLMLEAGVGILRTMPPAAPEALERLRRQAMALRVSWKQDETYADMLDRLDPASPQGAAFLVRAVTLFRGARWVPFDATDPTLPVPDLIVHGALATPYAHVTAPLRRLVDRFGLEVCLAASAGRDVPDWVRAALPELGDAMAAGMRRNGQVDRGCVDAVEAAVLAPHVGEEFTGIGLDKDTVQLSEPAIVARCDGEVKPGREQRVRLVSTDPRKGPRFATA